ncbi:MAG: AmmeMemoRadiSam system radical SAM enzyme [Desulfobacterales bacterium]|nr:AmmeMemoRadiSam system radical SAM enzyme [Desulfobacterales bacterium]
MREAMLYERIKDKDGEVHCYLCSHHCRIKPNEFGTCGMRQNLDGTLYTHAYGEVIAANADPVEKKPLYHFLPGSRSFSLATMGCNFQCEFCQNWQISQANRRSGDRIRGIELSPEKIVEAAKSKSCRSIAYTYTEPTVFFEYAYDTARLAKAEGIASVFITNGFMTRDAFETIQPYLDACNVDLKAFDKDFYKNICHGRLQPVLDTIRTLKDLGIWLEVTTLIVPGSNDSEKEIKGIADFLAGIDTNIPWHISRFHPDYKYSGLDPTALSVMKTAYELGKAAGLKHIYLGNVPGESVDTYCPGCNRLLIKRGAAGASVDLSEDGRCPECGEPLAGVF